MHQAGSQVLVTIIAVMIILIFMGVSMLVVLSYYNNRKLNSMREKERLTREFEQALLKTHLEVQEQTMRQISLELHDNIGQVLSLVNLYLTPIGGPTSDNITNASELLNKAMQDLRRISRTLNPQHLARTGLVHALEQEFKNLESTGKYKASLTVMEDVELAPNQLVILYRMIQEVIQNVIKHAAAKTIEAKVSRSNISISDDGNGFVMEDQGEGIGLYNLRERARVIGATVEVQSQPGKGTIVTFRLNNS